MPDTPRFVEPDDSYPERLRAVMAAAGEQWGVPSYFLGDESRGRYFVTPPADPEADAPVIVGP